MGNHQLTLHPTHIKITGQHYTVSNGFAAKAHNEVTLPYSDILTVELVKRRSKKMMYVILILGAVLIFALDFDGIAPAFVIALTTIICAIGVVLLFSNRQYVEITSMRGTYRIAVSRGDAEAMGIVEQLQARIFTKM